MLQNFLSESYCNVGKTSECFINLMLSDSFNLLNIDEVEEIFLSIFEDLEVAEEVSNIKEFISCDVFTFITLNEIFVSEGLICNEFWTVFSHIFLFPSKFNHNGFQLGLGYSSFEAQALYSLSKLTERHMVQEEFIFIGYNILLVVREISSQLFNMTSE